MRIQWPTFADFYLTDHIKCTEKKQILEYIGHKHISVREQQHFGRIDMPIYYYTLQQAFLLELIDEILCSIDGRKRCD